MRLPIRSMRLNDFLRTDLLCIIKLSTRRRVCYGMYIIKYYVNIKIYDEYNNIFLFYKIIEKLKQQLNGYIRHMYIAILSLLSGADFEI